MKVRQKRDILDLYKKGFSVVEIAYLLQVPDFEVNILLSKVDYMVEDKPVDRATYRKIFILKARGLSLGKIATGVGVSEAAVEKAYQKDKSKIKNDKRAQKCLELYRQGSSLKEIGQKFGITRERVRQITKKQFGYELGYGPTEQKARKQEINTAYRSIVQSSRGERREEVAITKFAEAKAKGLEPEYFDSLTKYAEATGINHEMLKEFVPEAYKAIQHNARIKSQRWSWHYDACRTCGTTSVKHRGYGYCEDCYTRSPEFKASQKRSHMKNRDTILAHNKKYAEEYYSRPEVIEKLERKYDLKYFDGNRKLALNRDGHKCIGCGMPTDIKDKAGRSKVRVWHLGNKNDNSLDNLGTYCQSCLFKHKGISPRSRFSRSN